MSLSRAFTTRRLRGGSDLSEAAKTPQRSNTTKAPQSIRHKISAPVQLIHTTNMLSYNAPDLPRPARSNSTNSQKSASDADSQTTSDSTPPTSPDIASAPQPNHLSCYFQAAGSPTKKLSHIGAEAPAIPRRSPSHTKKNSYDAITRQRSLSRTSRDSDMSMSTRVAPTFSRSASTSTRASTASHRSRPASLKQANAPSPQLPTAPSTSMHAHVKETHPFGHELAQVTELAEEYHGNGRLDVIDEEQQYLNNRGLHKFSADDYLNTVQGLSTMFFPDLNHATATTPLWI